LRTGIRTLGGALIGAATLGGLGALIDRSTSAADAIGKTAGKIGVGVEALQELRFAAKASGLEQQTLDMALQRFTRRAAEGRCTSSSTRSRSIGRRTPPPRLLDVGAAPPDRHATRPESRSP
jgi:hypothetical protein